ncbi:alpha-amylase family glycosyl hydrolase, partial [Xanthomonas arboricola pv. corylina]
TQPENLAFLERLRGLLDLYPNAVSLGEISSEDSLATTAEYTAHGRLHMGYSFELLVQDYSAAYIRETVSRLEATMLEGWPCWAISNHDVVRAVTRWGGAHASPAFARMVVAMLCSLRGSICLYQGEELGLGEAEVAFEDLRDPYGITFWPTFKGRDGCRTPMPWTDAPSAGFSSGKPWLPLAEEHRAAAVSVQQDDPLSVLSAVRQFLAWRKGEPALREGAITFYDTAEPVLMFRRGHAGRVMLLAFNLSAYAAELGLPAGAWKQVDVPGVERGAIEHGYLRLAGYAVVCAIEGG